MPVKIQEDCYYFNGDIPCQPHKKYGVHCFDRKGNPCTYYQKSGKKILIIKLGAIGDVIRTTPLLRKIREIYPHAVIWFLTYTPEVVPTSMVNHVLGFELSSIVVLEALDFDIVYNLDKDKEACALMKRVKGSRKIGFGLNSFGKCCPLNTNAEYRWSIGLFDDFSRTNQKTYQEQIFELCGLEYSGEKYVLDRSYTSKVFPIIDRSRYVIGINTGAGNRWQYKKWGVEGFIELITRIKTHFSNSEIILLGGPAEEERNLYIQSKVNNRVKYFGVLPLSDYIGLVGHCNAVITSDSLTLHIAIGLDKKIIVYFGPTPHSEIELYGLGKKVYSNLSCLGCFKQKCDLIPNCMDLITPNQMFEAVKEVVELK